MSHYIKNIEKDEKTVLLDNTRGGVQSVIYLTEQGVFDIVYNSNNPIAKEFKKWLYNIVKEIRKNGKYVIAEQATKEDANVFDTCLYNEHQKLGRHYALIESFKNKKILYICELKSEINGKKIIKIGETGDISSRIHGISCELGVPVFFIKAYEVLRNHDLEQYLIKHPWFAKYKYSEPMENGHISKELFYLTENFTISQIDKFIMNNINSYNKTEEQLIQEQSSISEKQKDITKNRELDIMTRKLDMYDKLLDIVSKHNITTNGSPLDKIIYKIKESADDEQKLQEIQNFLDSNPEETIEPLFFVKDKKTRGPYIQQYSPDLKLIQHFESVINVCRKINGTSASAIRTAIKNNTIYKGFRWFAIEKTSDPTIEMQIPATKQIVSQKHDYIALLNLDKNEILNVFAEQKDFAEHYRISHAAVCCAIKRKSRTQGGYIMFYSDVDEELRKNYELYHDLPIKSNSKNNKKIQQLHPLTKAVIKTYETINDVILETQSSRLSLMNAISTQQPFKNYCWQIVEN